MERKFNRVAHCTALLFICALPHPLYAAHAWNSTTLSYEDAVNATEPAAGEEAQNGPGEALDMIALRMKSLSAVLNEMPEPPNLNRTIDIPVFGDRHRASARPVEKAGN